MKRLSFVFVSLVFGSAAFGQTPFVENLLVAEPDITMDAPFNVLIPGSEKTVMITSEAMVYRMLGIPVIMPL